MQKFKVEIVETYRRHVEVKADDEDAAYQDIDDKITVGEIDLPCDGRDYKYDRELFVSEVKENNEWLEENNKKKVSGYVSVRTLGCYDFEFYVGDNATDDDIKEKVD